MNRSWRGVRGEGVGEGERAPITWCSPGLLAAAAAVAAVFLKGEVWPGTW